MSDNIDYNLFFEFIKHYSGAGFRMVNNRDTFMVRLNKLLYSSKQYFYIADVLKLQLLYTSPQIFEIIGLEPEKNDISYNFTFTHPLDLPRRSRARVNVIESGQELFIKKSGSLIISSNFRIKKVDGEYINVLVQCYLFYNSSPGETVYIIMIHTPIDKLQKFIKRGHYHWYVGTNMSFFRYPDKDLLSTGSNLSVREMEIIKYIQKGFDSKDIGEKLFLSRNTINTHRRNILKKTRKSSINEVIYDLDGIGIL